MHLLTFYYFFADYLCNTSLYFSSYFNLFPCSLFSLIKETVAKGWTGLSDFTFTYFLDI